MQVPFSGCMKVPVLKQFFIWGKYKNKATLYVANYDHTLLR